MICAQSATHASPSVLRHVTKASCVYKALHVGGNSQGIQHEVHDCVIFPSSWGCFPGWIFEGNHTHVLSVFMHASMCSCMHYQTMLFFYMCAITFLACATHWANIVKLKKCVLFAFALTCSSCAQIQQLNFRSKKWPCKTTYLMYGASCGYCPNILSTCTSTACDITVVTLCRHVLDEEAQLHESRHAHMWWEHCTST